MSYVKGEVTYQVYYNEKNSYGVYRVEIDETNEPSFDFHKTCTITGFFHGIEEGANYTFNGKMSFNPKYGYSFIVETYERILPTSKEGIIEYLSGDAFKGIGIKTATTIVETLGSDTIELILNDKNVLKKVPGLTDKKIDSIFDTLLTNRDLENTLITLYSYDITPKLAMRIIEKYGSQTLDAIKLNPYQLIDDIEGIAFIKADKIALKLGTNEKSFNRIEACINYCLMENAQDTGNTYVDKDELIDKVMRFLSFSYDDREFIERSIVSLNFKGKIKEIDNTLSDIRVYNAENYIASKLKLLNSSPKKSFFIEEIKRVIEKLETYQNFKYEDEQVKAIYSALTNNVSIITGGPGTGKTTIEKGIIYSYKELISNDSEVVSLCAPTGKAAKRIEESTGFSAKTIHKLLGYDAQGNFYYNKFNPLPTKLLIVDEASMIDCFLFHRLLESLNNDCKVVIVGDSDQLPSIGPGQILKDLIDSDVFVTTKLLKIHRQKENSKIISLAYNVLDEDISTEIDEEHDELSFIPSKPEDLNEILKSVLNHFMGLGYSLITDIEILVPIYKSMVGIDSINRYIQENFNSNYNFELKTDASNLFLDDKVIQLVNQYEDGVMNGDMGVITDILPESNEIIVDYQGNEVKYKGNDISNIQLAYSISVHKSQGSEFKVVILPVFNNYKIILNKKLIYTAITRAKEHLVIIGNFRALNDAIKIASKDRLTRLKSFL